MRYYLKLYQLSGFEDQYSNFNYKMFKKKIRYEQRKRMKKKNDKNAKYLNFTYKAKNRFWKLIKKIRKKKSRIQLDINLLEKNFKNLFNGKIIKSNEEQQKYLEEIEKNINEYEKELKGNNAFYFLCEEDLKRIINDLPNGKSARFREVTNEMFQYGMSKTLVNVTKNLLEKIIMFGKTPKFFNIGIIKPIIKDDQKSCNYLNNIRPITISDTISNIYEKVILAEREKYIKTQTNNLVLRKIALAPMQYLQLKKLSITLIKN